MAEEKTTFDHEHPEASTKPIYFNGFQLALGSGDVVINLHLNGKEAAQLNASYTITKSLVTKLQSLIDILERQSGHPIMSSDDVADYLLKEKEEKKIPAAEKA